MRSALGFFTRNWPLKIAAILLATLLYAGLIVSASAETFRGRIPIQVLNQPEQTFILGSLEDVTSVRYISVGTDRPPITSSSFTATIDLADVEAIAGAPPVSVPVVVRAVDPRIQVVDFSPSRVAVRLDPLVTKDVEVRVDLGSVPPGLDVREPVVSQDSVAVSGPDSAVRFVTAALARVRIDPSGLDVNETVGLLPVDARGEVVEGVDVQPSAVRVTIQIGSQLATRALPVSAVVTGTPASSVEIASIDVQPSLVTIEGEADTLEGLVSIGTRPISIAGATSDVVTEVGLVLPQGVAALDVEQVRVTIVLRPREGTRTIEAGIELVNPDPALAYRPAVDRVVLTVGGTLAALDALDASQLTARLDVAGLGAGTASVPVAVLLPAGVSLLSSSPPEVAVTVTAVATPAPAATPAAEGSPTAPPVASPAPEP
jgi:YbbR domain-containing protein